MAMLAEPRRKQKVINLRAKNNAWSNDSSKFGQRMLEKMGWTSGKGLGANENGITEHVVARYKNDEKGLGFEDKNDQWTKHEDDFNALLANLSQASDSTENLHSGISLEDKSKKSKARIHYHKFTRGKDISRYSEKDLANIFGKKSFKNTEVTEEPLKEDLKITEQVFTEKGSMEDYFKNKLAAFKSKSKESPQQNGDDCDEPCYAFHGFSQETDMDDTFNGIGFKSKDENCKDKVNDDECDSENVKKKKKKSKNKDNVYLDQDNQDNCERIEECIGMKRKEKLKHKNKNNYHDLVDQTKNELAMECQTDETTNKKKKSKKRQKEHSDKEIITCGVEEGDNVNKKKKKSKNKECSIDEPVKIDTQEENTVFSKRIHNNIEDVLETQAPKKKKKKKVKND